MFTPELVVALSFAGFVALILYFRVPGRIVRALDKRAAAIGAQIEEARGLREEAQQLLASYQRKQREAQREVEDIVTQAREEAGRFAKEMRDVLEQRLERRAKLAEQKIAQAETEAIRAVRNQAADLAIEAARVMLAKHVTENRRVMLADSAIAELRSKFN
jgi:F-type H+-transporting ATPase subunit b